MSRPHRVLWRNATVATFIGEKDYGLLPGHDILVHDGLIEAIAPTDSLPQTDEVVDVNGALITPSLVDCHTHLVFGGHRADEWERRQNGVTYQQISSEGGGINGTVRATRAAEPEALYQTTLKRLQNYLAEGVGLMEIKSGYGLDQANEAKMLRVAQRLQDEGWLQISRTLLAAHAVPPEFKDRADAYMDLVIDRIMPALWEARLYDCVDVFCENVGFTPAQTERLFQAAVSLGIPVKGHTEQLSWQGGSALVAKYGGWSADHVEYLDEAGVAALAHSGAVAVLLPGAFYFLRETRKPPVERLRHYGVPMAVASDFNPGTSPFASLRLAMNMACVQFGLTPCEAWRGVTVHAARALRRRDFGCLSAGRPAHFNVWDTDAPVDIIYELGRPFLRQRVLFGREAPIHVAS